ncbi:MAG: VCBS repeat-containing protein, partial [Pricia sp.]
VDGDNWKDVILLDQKGSSVLIFKGSEEGISEEPYSSLSVGQQPYGMDVGDLNQDKKADIVVSSAVDNEIWVMLSECK